MTAAAAGAPWAVLSAGVDHPTFLEQLRVALANGASGAIAGRSLWKDAVALDPVERVSRLERLALPRLREVQALMSDVSRVMAMPASLGDPHDVPARGYRHRPRGHEPAGGARRPGREGDSASLRARRSGRAQLQRIHALTRELAGPAPLAHGGLGHRLGIAGRVRQKDGQILSAGFLDLAVCRCGR